MRNRTYDFMKRLVQVILPAMASAYFALDGIWGLPAANEVVGTIAVITTFLGVSLGISSSNYKSSGAAYDGSVVVINKPDGGTTYSLELNPETDLDDIPERNSLNFEIKKNEDDQIL